MIFYLFFTFLIYRLTLKSIHSKGQGLDGVEGHSESGTQLLFSFLTVPLIHRQPPVSSHRQT